MSPPDGDDPLWDWPQPFVEPVTVTAADIDGLGHANNACYLAWLDRCAWAHSAAVGYAASAMMKLERAMVVRNVRMQYLLPTFEGEQLWVADWITHCDGRLRATRSFQILRARDGETVLRAAIDYVCINTSTGRPSRMLPAFEQAYCAVVANPDQS